MDTISEKAEEVISDEALTQQTKAQMVEEMMAYFRNHSLDEAHIEEHKNFITQHLVFSQGKIAIKGWLALLNFLIWFSLFISFLSIFLNLGNGIIGMAIANIAACIFYGSLCYNIIKRSKTTILLLRIMTAYYLASNLLMVFKTTGEGGHSSITAVITNLILIIYTFVSKRLKLTFVE